MPAEKKDGHTGADTASAGSVDIFSPKRCFPDRLAPDPLSALCRGQNPGEPLRVCSLERTSELGIRFACYSSSPIQKRASDSRAAPGALAAAVFPSMSDAHKAAGPGEIEPDLRSPAKYCRT